jgi:hypothetical protein
MVFGLSGCGVIRSAKLLVPTWFGFTRLSEGVYVDEEMPEGQRRGLLGTLGTARDRVSSVFGGNLATPKVFACSTEDCYVSHGGVTAKGKAYSSSMILLSPRGLNAVIVSHELTHIEFQGRVGTVRGRRAIPSWFGEGLL